MTLTIMTTIRYCLDKWRDQKDNFFNQIMIFTYSYEKRVPAETVIFGIYPGNLIIKLEPVTHVNFAMISEFSARALGSYIIIEE